MSGDTSVYAVIARTDRHSFGTFLLSGIRFPGNRQWIVGNHTLLGMEPFGEPFLFLCAALLQESPEMPVRA